MRMQQTEEKIILKQQRDTSRSRIKFRLIDSFFFFSFIFLHWYVTQTRARETLEFIFIDITVFTVQGFKFDATAIERVI